MTMCERVKTRCAVREGQNARGISILRASRESLFSRPAFGGLPAFDF